MDHIKITKDGPVRTIVLARPEKRNAINAGMLETLCALFSEAPEPADRVVVLRSEGHVFSAGLDLNERLQAVGKPGDSPILPLLHAVETYPLPVVAVVQGDAIAGGNELALHCDFVVASTAARFGMPLARIGRAPSWLLAKKLLESTGPVTTREMLFLAEPIPAARMYAAAAAVVEQIVGNAPLALRAIKALLGRAMTFRDDIEHADIDEIVKAARNSNDSREGIKARLEKRMPVFKGE
jgi:enoyl-CoA hydratase/carnithine racemase